MAFEVSWTARAETQLSEIIATIRSENPTAADRFVTRLANRVDGLGRTPRLGAVYRRRRGHEIRRITFGNYRILYRVRPRLRLIEIASVWHTARQEPKLP